MQYEDCYFHRCERDPSFSSYKLHNNLTNRTRGKTRVPQQNAFHIWSTRGELHPKLYLVHKIPNPEANSSWLGWGQRPHHIFSKMADANGTS